MIPISGFFGPGLKPGSAWGLTPDKPEQEIDVLRRPLAPCDLRFFVLERLGIQKSESPGARQIKRGK